MLQPPRVPLIDGPTPLVKLHRLTERLGGAPVWMKRDDLTGLELSGNKVRKLEFIAADAVANRCDTLVTEGTPQSNHCRATAAVCARLGLHAVLLFRPEAASAQGNHLLDVLFGAEVRAYPREWFEAERERVIAATLDELRSEGRQPRWTPMGASEPLGCWGYLQAARELLAQLEAEEIPACDLVLAVSSGATYCGLLLGLILEGAQHVRLWAVPVSDHVGYHQQACAALCRATIEKYELPLKWDDDWLRFVDGYVGEGYAIPYPDDIEAIRTLAGTEAILLDPVYTGKAFCALLDGVRNRRWGRERPVIFLHTGGIFSNFAWPDYFLA